MTGNSLSLKMASAQWTVLEIEAFNCLKQAIVRFLIHFKRTNQVPASHPAAVGATETHFNFWGPVSNQALWALIERITMDVVALHPQYEACPNEDEHVNVHK